MSMYHRVKHDILPSIWVIILMVVPLVAHAVLAAIGFDLFDGQLSKVTSAALVGLFAVTAIFAYSTYRSLHSVDRYEKMLERCTDIAVRDLRFVPTAVSIGSRDNLEMAQYVMDLARNSLVSMSVLSSPEPKDGKITLDDDMTGKPVYRRMLRGKLVADDFTFRRVISLQDTKERAFAQYLVEREAANSAYARGRFRFKVYPVKGNGEKGHAVQFPNFIIADSRYIFMTFRQYDQQSRGFFFCDPALACALESYFSYLWYERCIDANPEELQDDQAGV